MSKKPVALTMQDLEPTPVTPSSEALPGGYSFYVREFINSPGFDTVGSILATINRQGYPNLVISDCNRSIQLSLSGYEDGYRDDFENTIKKLDLIASTINNLKKEVVKQARRKGYRKEVK